MKNLLDAGVDFIIDLTEEGELDPYGHLVRNAGTGCGIVRRGIEDMSVPGRDLMKEILDILDENLFSGKTVYFHCWGEAR